MVLFLSYVLYKALATSMSGPAKMGMKLLRTIRDQAEREINPDESEIKQKLMEMEGLLEAGQMSEADYETREAELMARWRAIQEGKAQG